MELARVLMAGGDVAAAEKALREAASLRLTKALENLNGYEQEILHTDALVGAIEYYDAQVDDARLVMNIARTAADFGASDLTLTGATGGPVTGSFFVDDTLRRLTFIATGGPLAADTYTVAMRSADNGFKDTAGNLLDGDANGTAGGDYSGTFTIAEAAANAVTLAGIRVSISSSFVNSS